MWYDVTWFDVMRCDVLSGGRLLLTFSSNKMCCVCVSVCMSVYLLCVCLHCMCMCVCVVCLYCCQFMASYVMCLLHFCSIDWFHYLCCHYLVCTNGSVRSRIVAHSLSFSFYSHYPSFDTIYHIRYTIPSHSVVCCMYWVVLFHNLSSFLFSFFLHFTFLPFTLYQFLWECYFCFSSLICSTRSVTALSSSSTSSLPPCTRRASARVSSFTEMCPVDVCALRVCAMPLMSLLPPVWWNLCAPRGEEVLEEEGECGTGQLLPLIK